MCSLTTKRGNLQLTHCPGETWEKGNLARHTQIQVERELYGTETETAEKFSLSLN